MPVAQEAITPTSNLTQAIATVQAKLTQSVTPGMPLLVTPSASAITVSSTPMMIVTNTPGLTSLPGTISATALILDACDQAVAGTPIDITIPDDTLMEPGESFTKIWRLQNAGSCTWTTNYRVFFFSGDQLGAVNTVALGREVPPRGSIDIAIDMVAPARAGTFQGNWKLRNPDGYAFGIGPSGSASFWVRIVVEVTPTPTSSRTLTPTFQVTQTTPMPGSDTATPSATATETPPTSLGLSLNPGDALNLDSGEINGGDGQDILYESNPDGLHRISPQSGAVIGLFGEQLPSQADCENADLETTSLVAVNLVQRYTCFRTEIGQTGWFFLSEINPNTYTTRLDFLTWRMP